MILRATSEAASLGLVLVVTGCGGLLGIDDPKLVSGTGGSGAAGAAGVLSVGGLNPGDAGTGGISGGAGSGATAGTTTSGGMPSSGGQPTGGLGTGGTQTGGTPTVGGATGATAAGGTGGGAETCPGAGGPTMVRLPEGYCIDSTEVTRAQYSAWLSSPSPPSTARQILDCVWNTTFAPDATCMATSSVCQAGCDNHPQPCVDWCDAYAYCQAVGKRMCGKIGGGPNEYYEYNNANLSQWYNACTSHDPANYTYPYGNAYQATTCNGYDYWGGSDYTTLAVGTLMGCQSPVSGYQGVFDLTGNLYEWEDSCNGSGSLANCRLRGGCFANNAGPTCGTINNLTRSSYYGYLGFRCCS